VFGIKLPRLGRVSPGRAAGSARGTERGGAGGTVQARFVTCAAALVRDASTRVRMGDGGDRAGGLSAGCLQAPGDPVHAGYQGPEQRAVGPACVTPAFE